MKLKMSHTHGSASITMMYGSIVSFSFDTTTVSLIMSFVL